MPSQAEQEEDKAVVRNTILMKHMVAEIAKRSGHPKETVSAVLLDFKSVVYAAMIEGDVVDMGKDFGRFETIELAGRNHYVPSTGGIFKSGQRRKMRFYPASRKLKYLPPVEQA